MPDRENSPDADVIIVGAGAVGLWLAAELRLGGATVTIVEKRATRSPRSRAHTLHARTLELFAARGLVGPWLDEGIEIPTTHYAMLSSRLDLTGLDSDFPFVLFLPQVRTEELLEEHALASGVRVLRGLEVRDIADSTNADSAGASASADSAHRAGAATGAAGARTAAGVHVTAVDSEGRQLQLSGRYLVGCDGRRSIVRAASGIGYSGTEDVLTCVIADVELSDDDVPSAMTMHSDGGSFYAVRIDSARYRLVALEHASMSTPRDAPLGFDEFRGVVRRLVGRDFGMRDPSWLTRVGSATFQADRYRQGRTLLAGDAAHVHFPMGGQGLNLGLQDAMNLGWKLAAVVRSAAPPALLDTYELERAPVGRAVIDDTLAQTALIAVPGREGQALRGMMTKMLADNAALNSRLALSASGIDVTYPSAAGAHPLVGHRVPNLRLKDGSDVFGLLHQGKFCLVGMPPDAIAEALGAQALDSDGLDSEAAPDSDGPDSDAVELRALASRALTQVSVAPSGFATDRQPWDQLSAALIRPDGHLAWAADRDTDDRDAVGRDTANRNVAGRDTANRDSTDRDSAHPDSMDAGDSAATVAGAVAELLRWLPGLAAASSKSA
jgi:2-polyprenyl-6-methoxyphenol hydroxylase-like FAD-dependent oxidoreductase